MVESELLVENAESADRTSLRVQAKRLAHDPRIGRLCGTFCDELGVQEAAHPVRKAVQMLRLSGFDLDDIEVCFAMTLCLMRASKLTQQMGAVEKALVALIYAYCCHSLVFDEFVPLKVWHEWAFAHYCNRQMLNVALRKVCIAAKWRFLVPPENLDACLRELRGAEPRLKDRSDSSASLSTASTDVPHLD